MNKEKKLTPRQWSLYNLLRANPDQLYSKKEICDIIPTFTYKQEKWDKCVDIWNDMNEINKSLEVDGIIVMKNQLFKFGTKEEVKEFRNSKIKKLKKLVSQIEMFDIKTNRDNQGKLISNQNKPIDEESKAKRFYETYFND